MKGLRKLLTITVIVSALSFISMYQITQFISKKIKEEAISFYAINYHTKQLKDIYTLCMLDYKINPKGEDILKECQQVKEKLIFTMENSNKDRPFFNFYNEYLK